MPEIQLIGNTSGDFRYEDLEGRRHMVVPCTMIVNGVLKGSQGAYLYPDEENGRNPSAWDHMPIVVYHPKVNGKFVSARKPTFLNNRKVGLILNTKHEDGKLKTEAWIDEERVQEVDKRVYESVLAKKPMEVSTGLTFEVEGKEGEFNGTKYIGIARNYQPDHLAILPDQVGACSLKDGAGLFANVAEEPESTQHALQRSIANTLKSIGGDLVNNVLSFSQTSRMLSDALSSKYGEKGKYWNGWVVDVYPAHVVFCAGYTSDRDCYSVQEYKATDTMVELVGEPKEAKRSVSYLTPDGKALSVNSSGQLSESDKETEMPFDKAAHIRSLVGNGFEEADRPWLEQLPDDRLAKILPKGVTIPVSPPIVTPPPPVVPVLNAAGVTVPTLAQLIANADPGTQAMFADMQSTYAKEKTTLVAKIQGAPGCQFTANDLNAMAIPNLRAIAALVPDPNMVGNGQVYDFGSSVPGAYAGAAGFAPPLTANEQNEDPPLPPEMSFGVNRGQ